LFPNLSYRRKGSALASWFTLYWLFLGILPEWQLHVAENEIISHLLIPSMVLIPVDSESKAMLELVVRSFLQ
jgi:hypothetical protein